VKAATEPSGKRPYRMRARAEAAAATGERIVGAAGELFMAKPYDEVSLDEIAARAGVSAQTVIRRYGSKEALFSHSLEWGGQRVLEERSAVPVGDVRAAVDYIVGHYDKDGDTVLRWLAQEERFETTRRITAQGRRIHREWVARTFAHMLDGRRGKARERRLCELVAVTDVLFWKLLRRDMKLSRRDTAAAMLEVLTALEGDT
jgi:AcrR family transcriptional regulator